MRLFGLIGNPLVHSFSKKYFTEKFYKEAIPDAAYELFQIEAIDQLRLILQSHENLEGLNVTIPYKQEVIPYLHAIDANAKTIGACNCIKISKGELRGFNTDAPAFENSLKPLLQGHHSKALVLGTGGAAKAVTFTLERMSIDYSIVSRTGKANYLTYDELTQDILEDHLLIINTTPLGSFPKVDEAPPIPYQYLTARHYLYDLVYNPSTTLFLQNGREHGALTKNGYDMLVGQAELSWKIWNDIAF